MIVLKFVFDQPKPSCLPKHETYQTMYLYPNKPIKPNKPKHETSLVY